jgi:aspartate/methionine/tyrosine aminotransferase
MMQMFKAAAKRTGLINLTLGEPDVPTDPRIVEAARQAGLAGETHYTQSRGNLSLRAAVSRRWADKYGFVQDPEEILVTTGGSQACWLAFQTLLEPGDEVLLLEPYFTFYAQQVRYNQGVPVAVPCRKENHFLPLEEDLRRAVTRRTKALVVNSPCNPSGAVYDRATLEGIARVALEQDLCVLSDELYESYVFQGSHIPFATLPGMRERTLTIGGFSKSYAMCGWRSAMPWDRKNSSKPMDLLAIVQTLSVNTMVATRRRIRIERGSGCGTCHRRYLPATNRYAASLASELPGVDAAPPRELLPFRRHFRNGNERRRLRARMRRKPVSPSPRHRLRRDMR